MDYFLTQNAEFLKKEGYDWEYSADGYRITFKGEFVHAAGVKLPRSKPLHWKHARQNMKDNHESCIREALKHYNKNNPELES